MSNILYTVAGNVFKKLLDLGDGSHVEQAVAVHDVAFYERRQLYYQHEFSLGSGETEVIESIIDADYIVNQFEIRLVSGQARSEVIVGGSSTGTFDNDINLLSANTIEDHPEYTSATTIKSGGGVTGGFIVDTLRVKAGTGGASGSSIAGGRSQLRGAPAGTLHVKLTGKAAGTDGILYVQFEERA